VKPYSTHDKRISLAVARYGSNGSPCTITLAGDGSVLDDVCSNERFMRMSLTKNG
jgi:hypothetical protein